MMRQASSWLSQQLCTQQKHIAMVNVSTKSMAMSNVWTKQHGDVGKSKTCVVEPQAAKTDAEKHARLLTKLSAQISSAKLRSMEEVIPFVQDAQQQLSVLRADEGLTVSQFEAWPKQRLDVLREAAGQYRELSYLQVKYQKWMLQQVWVL